MLEQLFSCSMKDSGEPAQDKSKCITTRQRSCAFVNTPLPCINKAIHHIQELEVKLEKCIQQYDRVFKEEKIPWITKNVSAELDNDTCLPLSTKLDFQDANLSCKDSNSLTLKLETKALLLEVTELIKRLDADCQEAEAALEQEKLRRKKLAMKLDSMSLWRLQQLPAAVQKEYEACTQDILELQWHFDCKSHQLQQVENQVLKIETANNKIQEDIDFMKKHSPLLEEKLNREDEATKDVLAAYEKVEDLNNKIAAQGNENIKISEACSEMIKATEKLKFTCEGDLQTIKKNLLDISEALNALKCGNEELLWENEELFQKSANSSRQKKKYQSETKTVCKNIHKVEEQIQRVNKDLCDAELSYGEKKAKYEDLEKKITSEKIHYKRLEVTIKKEIQVQKGVVRKTQAEIKAIYGELEEKRKEVLKKKEEDMKRIEEIERPVADLETKFRKNKDTFKENHEKLWCLDQRAQELDNQQKQTEQQLEQTGTTLQQQLNDTQEKCSVVSSQIAENSQTTEDIRNKLGDLNSLWNMKEKQLENTEKSIIDLEKKLSDVMFKQQNVQMAFNDLQDELAEYEKRLNQEEKTYGKLLQTRKKNLKDLE